MTTSTLPRSDFSRINRIRVWILVLTLLPAAGVLIAGRGKTAAGLSAGGFIILINLLGTQHAVWNLVEGQGVERIGALIIWLGKFGITVAVILGLLHTQFVGPVALLLGLMSLPLSLVFDIFLFPVNKGEAKKP